MPTFKAHMWQKLKKIAWYGFIAINVIAVLFYLLACSTPWLNAGNHPYIAILSLLFPLLCFALLGLLLYWLMRKSKWAIVIALTLTAGWKSFSVMLGFNSSGNFIVQKATGDIRILTWNLSSWGESGRGNEAKVNYHNQMMEVIKEANPDLLCFQEFTYSAFWNNHDSVAPDLKAMGYQYSYLKKTRYAAYQYKPNRLTSVAIFSKYPIEDTAHYDYNDADFAEPLISADININQQKIRVFTTHLQSVRFDYDDYDALRNLKTPYKASVQQSRATAGKLKYAYKRRALEADTIHSKIQGSPYPVILCGDFNDVPTSYTYFTARGNLQDAFLQKGSGFGRTFRYISPTLRIDYILADKKFDIVQYHIFKASYSDHYPVVTDLRLISKN